MAVGDTYIDPETGIWMTVQWDGAVREVALTAGLDRRPDLTLSQCGYAPVIGRYKPHKGAPAHRGPRA